MPIVVILGSSVMALAGNPARLLKQGVQAAHAAADDQSP